MGPLNLVLWVAGVVLVVIGTSRAKGPWSRYQVLRAQDANIARYESWRGGLRSEEKTGASVAMDILRRQARRAGAVAIAGFVLVVAGFVLR